MQKPTKPDAQEFEPAVLVTYDEFNVPDGAETPEVAPVLLEEIEETDGLIQSASGLSR